MLNIYIVKMINEAVAEVVAAAAVVLALVELLAWAVVQWKKKVDETFYGIILVHIMHSQPDAIHVKMTRILAIKYDQKDLAKH